MMDKDIVIKIINDLYRMTSLFPKKEPLRYKMREVSDELLFNFTTWEHSKKLSFTKEIDLKIKESIFEMDKNIETINNYFDIVKWQNWASYFDVLELQEKFKELKKEITIEMKKVFLKKEEKKERREVKEEKLCKRKEKIILFLRENDRAQVNDISKVMPSVAKRTLRRDFLYLIERGLIERRGEKNSTYYRIKEA